MTKSLLVIFSAFLLTITAYSQNKPLSVSLNSIRTDAKQAAFSFAVEYLKELDSLFATEDIFLAKDNHLFTASPFFEIRSGSSDAFSSVTGKLEGFYLFFKTAEIDGIITPNSSKMMHVVPLSLGFETGNSFETMNAIAEIGYVPWYQLTSVKLPLLLKYTKCGVFLQGGYKFKLDSVAPPVLDSGEENPNDPLLRLKGNLSFDTQKLIESNKGKGIGLIGYTDVWYDFINSAFYYRIEGRMRVYLMENTSIDFLYEKGSGAPTFLQGEQYGIGLNIRF